MSSPHHKTAQTRDPEDLWVGALAVVSALLLASFLFNRISAQWTFALGVSLFPVILLGVARPPLGGAVRLLLGALFLVPTAVLLIANGETGWLTPSFQVTVLGILIGFWLVPLVATTLLHAWRFPTARSPAPGRNEAGRHGD